MLPPGPLRALLVTLAMAPMAARADEAPLRLEDAVNLALHRNERARIAELDVQVAQAAVERAHTRFLPVLELGGSDTFRPAQIDLATGAPANSATATLSLQQPVLDLTAFPLLAQAKHALEAQRDQSAEDQRTLAFDAARAFFAVLNAQAVSQAAQRRMDTARAALDDARARAAAQLASSNDATRAEVDLANAAREAETDVGGAKNAAIELGLVLDVPPPTTLQVPDAMLEVSRKPVVEPEPLVRSALGRRLDLASLKKAALAAHDSAREPLLRLAPTLGFSGQAQATTNTQSLGRWGDASLQLTLSWVLYDAGVRYADLHSREATAQIADLQALNLARTVQAEVQSAVTTLRAAQATFEVADKAVAVAHRNAEETEALYRQGLAKAIELIDANDQVFLAEVSDAEARYSMALAYLELRSALGLDPLGLELP